jgi:CHRD domain
MLKMLACAAILLTANLCADTASADELFKATLGGGQEVPPVATDATGKALLRLNKAENEIEFQLHVSDGVGITVAHIHCAPVGVNGTVVVFLAGLNPAGLDVDGKWVSNATITDASIVDPTCGTTVSELAESMRNGGTYANVHSVDHPLGVVRGQIESTH